MSRTRELFVSLLLASVVTLTTTRANAQLHVDVGVEGGAMARFLTERPPGSPVAAFGPAFELQGHVALLPLLRAGVYVAHDISAIAGIPARQITSAGIHLRATPPLLRGRWRSWVFAGFGYAGVYAPGYEASNASGGVGSSAVTVPGAGGSYFEVPLGLGVGYLFRKPWELTVEIGSRIGFGFRGSLYGDDGGRAAFPVGPAAAEERIKGPGDDTFAFSLSVGIALDL